ncbi:agamous-like MADS-box protein AGL80 [Vicia villosa]|uniref:agamous-like MADS-box protein AGL80 n=1 Tax=Vicia villosa TaxID=3911 RepID=UPI00273B0D1C|nr:agamous-like MADS-box protein AGL80 [Vicia villosa]
MARKKLKLAFIENNTARKSAYKNRKKGLVKKVDQLATLCGIEACAIIYGPDDHHPVVWPSPSGVQNVLSKFMTWPEFEQRKNMVNQDSFLSQRISKAQMKLKTQSRDNREKETTMLMFQCLDAGKVVQNDMSGAGLNDLAWTIDQNLKKIDRRLESGDNEMNIHRNQCENEIMTAQSHDQLQMEQPLLLPLPPPLPPTTANNGEIAMMSDGHLQTAPPLPLLPPPPPPTAPNNDEMALMGHGHVGMATNNNDMMFMDMLMNDDEWW